ncbi:hypothetical protein DESC_830003 [Desulfosarcina cetonica]|nr:hypothetical protein DESC_830003 [Desulfosarcina cetonica]
MDAKKPQKGEQYPGDGIVDRSGPEADVGLAIHGRDQEQIHQPTDAQQAQGEEIDRPGDGFAIIKPMGPGETENPQNIADGFQMGIVALHLLGLHASIVSRFF